jgi:hypothetical protein
MLGLGHWPPAFHGAEAIWFLLTGVGKVQALLFIAAISAGLATTVFVAVQRRLGLLYGLLAAGLVLANPLIQTESAQIMLDVACAWLALLATLCFARYLQEFRWRDSVLFGGFSAVALLTKGNTALLALVPPITMALTNRWRAVLRPSLWISAVIVVLVAGPFYLATYGWGAKGFGARGASMALAISTNAMEMWQMFGAGICAFALIGTATRVLKLGRVDKPDTLWPALLALAIATFIIQAIIPVPPNPRYLAPMVAPIIALAVVGLHDFVQLLRNAMQQITPPALAAASLLGLALLAGPVVPATLAARPWQCRSLESIAVLTLKHLPASNPVVLVGAHAFGEHAFATELAMRDPNRPSMVVAFGSRLFGAEGFMNDWYAERYASDQELEAVIDDLAIPYVIVDLSPPSQKWGHNQRLRRIAEARWQLQESVVGADGAEVRLYKIAANAARPVAGEKLNAALSPRRKIPGSS